MLKLLFILVVGIPSLCFAEGFQFRHQGTTRDHQSSDHTPQNSVYRNRWQIQHRYYLDRYGRPISSGQMNKSGDAQRYYQHSSNPADVAAMKEKEAGIAAAHEKYKESTRGNLKSQADLKMMADSIRSDKERLRTVPGDELRNNNAAIASKNAEMADRLTEIFKSLQAKDDQAHTQKMSGK